MPEPITCERVEREELDLKYLRGTLPELEAEAFEEHYFGCDTCWSLVRAGNEVRAAGAAPRAARRVPPWAFALAAAMVAAVGVTLWRGSQSEDPSVSVPSTERGGPAAALVLKMTVLDRTLTAEWSRVPEATGYRIRFFGSDGSVLLQRQTTDTVLTVSRDSVARAGALWQVQALDRLGAELIRSALVEVR